MNNTNQKRYYSPQFSETACIAVKRLSWALNLPMTKIIELMVKIMPSVLNAQKICSACQDKSKCQNCAFHNVITPQEQENFLLSLAEYIV